MTDSELSDLDRRNAVRTALRVACTHGPWHVRYLVDDHAMNFVAESTKPDSSIGERWPAFEGSEIVAATLVQQPKYASIDIGRWDENAKFIAFCRMDTAAEDIDALIKEVQRLSDLARSH